MEAGWSSIANWLGQWLLPVSVVGAVGTPLGFVLVAWGGRRRMYRRNFAGVEEFQSHSHMVGARLLEALADLIGGVLFLGGSFALMLVVFILYYRHR